MGQSILLSCVGDSDPIRNFHDGALVHIARCLKPTKIVLLQSERSLKKKNRVIKALGSIKGYSPEIVDSSYIIKNNDVYQFDRMFEIIDRIVMKYVHKTSESDQIILNLTSGTPEMIAAMFSVNRIRGLNVRAFQVMTPNNSTNMDVKHDDDVPIDELIADNLDDKVGFTRRIVEDKAERYGQELLKKQARDYVNTYNYGAILKMIFSENGIILPKSKRKKVKRIITKIEENVRYQKNIPEAVELGLSQEETNLLSEYLVIQLQTKRQLSSEVLMRVSSLAELAAKIYLKKRYDDVVEEEKGRVYLNVSKYPSIARAQGKHAYNAQNLIGYSIILSMLESSISSPRHLKSDSVFNKHLKNIIENKKIRNMVSHTLNEVEPNEFDLNKVLDDCYYLVFETLEISKAWNDYYDVQNEHLLKLLS
ncbi:type III-A CRISPR-associated CARF protein Csm6 [Ligilactobacillus acidipiscis]|uniref:type III-A CRISPR-associated CARF protein Csm6 n=1 Tax=Ligilactobacillus acidipiscis TaxID=89059 RepID=UPI0023F6519C|nr:hypothetical protein [Ligilactobacillus acidipiscis]WEV56230.1 hypothetical protein OZX66_08280 [Ligilactobacillus acidipiscis]